ncbi:MAG: HAMP domain-containing histidine kinase [Gorillibacterium sp.]|nr:HAMP domain-containing histidine kinase [Gorillibacterium sp.]
MSRRKSDVGTSEGASEGTSEGTSVGADASASAGISAGEGTSEVTGAGEGTSEVTGTGARVDAVASTGAGASKNKTKGRKKWRKSLLVRYLFIVVLALLLWPIVLPAASFFYYLPDMLRPYISGEGIKPNPYESREELENMWHDIALHLDGKTPHAVDKQLHALKLELPKARMFWVDGAGQTMLSLPNQPQLPASWTASDSIAFMKQSYAADPYTVVAFIGEKPDQGFMVLQVPHVLMTAATPFYMGRFFIIVMTVVFIFFLFTSWLFFYRIRKRLVRLEGAMASRDTRGIPYPVEVKREDEIGQLEHAFNGMISELDTGRKREQQEESLRKQLIANLSHDLRTPLTIIRSHAYSLKKDDLSESGQESIALIEAKSDDLNQLIDDLLSYTLLSAGKYPLERETTDMVRLLRTTAASWYPLFETEGFEVVVSLPDYAIYWQVDPRWMTRILDNLLQNIVRHAKAGRYVGFYLEEKDGQSVVILEDHGPGLETPSVEKGAGIGLEIVALMVKELGLRYDLESSSGRTRSYLYGPESTT